MTAQLDKIITLFENGILIKIKVVEDLDLIMEKRDSDPFDSDWMSVFNEIEAELKKNVLDKLVIDKINKIRELAFKSAFHLTNSGELSGYVSDDFELIAKGVVVESKNFWLTALFSTYLSADLPCAHLRLNNVEINALLNDQFKRV